MGLASSLRRGQSILTVLTVCADGPYRPMREAVGGDIADLKASMQPGVRLHMLKLATHLVESRATRG